MTGTSPSTATRSPREAETGIVCTDVVRIFTAEGVEVQALQGLNLRVDSGELVAVVGASGSGKSTLLGILSGLDAPSAGKAIVAGRDLGTLERRDRLEYRRSVVGFVWQQVVRNLLPYLTVRENLAMARSVTGARIDAGAIDELLGLLGITHCADRVPSRISGGEQQRAAIAVALVNEPLVLLADEPTGALDERTAADVLEMIRRVNEELGVTTLIVTHDPSVADHVGRTVRIRDGRTSTEILRRADAAGTTSSEEFTVIDPSGRLQLPPEYTDALALRDRVKLVLADDHVGVFSGTAPPVLEVGDPRTSPSHHSSPRPTPRAGTDSVTPTSPASLQPGRHRAAPAADSGEPDE